MAALPDTAALFSADELAQWPGEAVAALKAQKVINKARPASSVVCPGCEEECVRPVITIPAPSDDSALFVVCDKRSDVNRVEIPPARLVQWQASTSSLSEKSKESLFDPQ